MHTIYCVTISLSPFFPANSIVGGGEYFILDGVDLVELGLANQLGELDDENDNSETNSLD